MFFSKAQNIYYWVNEKSPPNELALRDLQRDFDRVLSANLIPCESSSDADIILVNLQHSSWPGLSIKANEWERYQITIIDEKVIIAGSDTRGLLFGIYQFSQNALGVDPLWFWIPEEPKSREHVDPAMAQVISEAPNFKYRGWFINGEDRLEEWKYGTDRKGIDWYGTKQDAISYETYEKLFEAMLRLRVNLIIPATVMDIFDTDSVDVYNRISRRGLMFSQHHIEPVGVCPSYSFRNYCRRNSIQENFSWINNREVVESCWRNYIDKIAEFGDSVVWQLGYRGAGDQPFWKAEKDAPKDMAGRADIISGAIARQYQLICERIGNKKDIACTTTLWWEGNVLYKQGLLRIPEEVMVIISDVARTQMFPIPFPTCEKGRKYGVYYHTSYWSTGPHMIQGTPPSKVFDNYKIALDAGADEYSMHHVSNFRPFLPIVQGVAQLTFDNQSVNAETFLANYCESHYGNREISKLYNLYFKAFVHRKEDDLREQNTRWLDGALALMIRNTIEALNSFGKPSNKAYQRFMAGTAFRLQLLNENKPIEDLVSAKISTSWLCGNWSELTDYTEPLLSESLVRWEKLLNRIKENRVNLSKGCNLYDSNLYWQSIVGHALTSASLLCFKGVSCWINEAHQQAEVMFNEGAKVLDQAIHQGKVLAEQEHFGSWTTGDRYMDLKSLCEGMQKYAHVLGESKLMPLQSGAI
jgi:hypothetical protein